jgi:excisionase family DNA binding protein
VGSGLAPARPFGFQAESRIIDGTAASFEPEAASFASPASGSSPLAWIVTEPLLTTRELGEYLGLSAGTVLDRWEAGDLPGFRLFGRKGGPVRFRLSEVEAELEAWRCGPAFGKHRLQ